MIDEYQSNTVGEEGPRKPNEDYRETRHQTLVRSLLPSTALHGYYAIEALSISPVAVPQGRLESTFLNPDRSYGQTLDLSTRTVPHHKGYSRVYSVRRKDDWVASQLTTCYFDGLVVSDGYLDIFLEDSTGLNPNWLTYMIQRHLQLTREVMEEFTQAVTLKLRFDQLQRFEWEVYRGHRVSEKQSYTGYHEDIIRVVELDSIYGRDQWNRVIPVVKDLIMETARIFGFSRLPQPYWNADDQLDYARIPGR